MDLRAAGVAVIRGGPYPVVAAASWRKTSRAGSARSASANSRRTRSGTGGRIFNDGSPGGEALLAGFTTLLFGDERVGVG
jgi:hypothetical protein